MSKRTNPFEPHPMPKRRRLSVSDEDEPLALVAKARSKKNKGRRKESVVNDTTNDAAADTLDKLNEGMFNGDDKLYFCLL
jgi:hypothetical protein